MDAGITVVDIEADLEEVEEVIAPTERVGGKPIRYNDCQIMFSYWYIIITEGEVVPFDHQKSDST